MVRGSGLGARIRESVIVNNPLAGTYNSAALFIENTFVKMTIGLISIYKLRIMRSSPEARATSHAS